MNTEIKLQLIEVLAAKGFKNVADISSEEFTLYKVILSDIYSLSEKSKIKTVRLQSHPFGCDRYLAKWGEYIIYEQLTDVLNIYITANHLTDTLIKKGYNVRVSDAKEQELRGGTAVVVIDPEIYRVKPYSIGVVGGCATPLGTGNNCDITFSYSAYKEDECCTCSGGPATITTPFECLKPTGLEIEISFWRFKGGYRMANNSEEYKEFVPLFEYYQSEKDAKVQKQEITKERYNELYNVLPPIGISSGSFFNDGARDEKGELLYWIDTDKGFAVSEPYNHTTETVVLTVCFREKYKKCINEKWVEAQPEKYFEQLMLVYTPPFKPIFDTYAHHYGKNYEARPYYKHSQEYTEERRKIEKQQYYQNNRAEQVKPIYTHTREELELMLSGYSRKYIIHLIKTQMDKDAAVTDESYIAEYGRPATKPELLEVFWALYYELQPLVKG